MRFPSGATALSTEARRLVESFNAGGWTFYESSHQQFDEWRPAKFAQVMWPGRVEGWALLEGSQPFKVSRKNVRRKVLLVAEKTSKIRVDMPHENEKK